VPIDILIFAAIAAFLVFRLRSILGTKHGDERQRKNPFADTPAQESNAAMGNVIDLPSRPVQGLSGMKQHISNDAALIERIETGLTDIAAADATFDIGGFMQGARGAFEMIVQAYASGDVATLKPLLSPKLFKDFAGGIEAREKQGHRMETILHRIKAARIIEARLAGTMAYVTVDFDAEETSSTKDSEGRIVAGNPNELFSVRDVWTFTRDVRATDPNWMLIETRTAEG
jgi:predicted lipid-binding transport protein (Tim44 family)